MKSRMQPRTYPVPRSNKHNQTYLKRTDSAVLKYLHEITPEGDGATCKASIPKIANACSISERQVQICTNRLIKAGLIERIGYDLGNADRLKRGTIYKLLGDADEVVQITNKDFEKKRLIKFLLIWSEE